jgi:hypothetical protein
MKHRIEFLARGDGCWGATWSPLDGETKMNFR